jgi:hypothetical protein
MYIG